MSHEFPNVEWVKKAVRHRLQDQFIQEWNMLVHTSPKGISYRVFKTEWGCEKYLLELPTCYRIPMCKFRTCNHKLSIEKGRYTNVPRAQRMCNMCDAAQLGDEFHFLFQCTKLTNIRAQYIPRYYVTRSNTLKMEQLMNVTNKKLRLNIARFIRAGLK